MKSFYFSFISRPTAGLTSHWQYAEWALCAYLQGWLRWQHFVETA